MITFPVTVIFISLCCRDESRNGSYLPAEDTSGGWEQIETQQRLMHSDVRGPAARGAAPALGVSLLRLLLIAAN